MTFAIALAIVLPLLNYPLAAMLVLILMLFWTFYLGQRGTSPFVVMMLLTALTLVPVLGLGSIDLSVEIARTLSLPNLLFLTLLMALVCLLLGRRMFQGGVAGAICGTALTTVLLIIGMTVAPIGPDADAKFLGRIVQVIAAAVYVVGAFALVSTVVKKDDGKLGTQAARA